MKILEDFAKISCIGNRWHETSKRKFGEVIFLKNGKVTDSSYANIIFFDGKQWLTPSTFLLNGTCRQRLLNEGKITESPIHYTDIRDFQQIGFINAMLDMGEFNLPISKLVK